MSTFTSKKYPELTVKFGNREKVRFERGTVEVEGETADRLADYAERHPEFQIASDDYDLEAATDPDNDPDADDEPDSDEDEDEPDDTEDDEDGEPDTGNPFA